MRINIQSLDLCNQIGTPSYDEGYELNFWPLIVLAVGCCLQEGAIELRLYILCLQNKRPRWQRAL
jgi:hypothetical protein